ncbi:hypothetical protein GGX14DRAFT_597966 [Mycena pura]|uniref:Zn(2)-C6 fungal-type domain-containing protein n=1 Tax=Mycena pura TaxID=153505 RepID=A0AAD6VNS9_9AGAR|nr:hypothetical protein GGX14DRAFT_597966 [Mycena pura]
MNRIDVGLAYAKPQQAHARFACARTPRACPVHSVPVDGSNLAFGRLIIVLMESRTPDSVARMQAEVGVAQKAVLMHGFYFLGMIREINPPVPVYFRVENHHGGRAAWDITTYGASIPSPSELSYKEYPTYNFPPPPLQMTDSMSYSSGSYMSHSAYYPGSSPEIHHAHHLAQQPRPEQQPATRKRPKYTRSKTGCLTCRVKKIKCDEAKPNCMRCTHGQRDCTWPEGVPARKRAPSLKGSPDGSTRQSTSSSTASPGLSSASSPSTRGQSPPHRSPVELSLPSDLNLPPLLSSRRQPSRERGRYSPDPHSHSMPPVHVSQYPARYDAYGHHGHHDQSHSHLPNHLPSRHTLAASSVRSTVGHPAMQQWSPPPLMTPTPNHYVGPPAASSFHTQHTFQYQAERPLISGDQMSRYH